MEITLEICKVGLKVARSQSYELIRVEEWQECPTTLYSWPLVSHGIAMCADWMNGDVRVTKVTDELYCMYSSST